MSAQGVPAKPDVRKACRASASSYGVSTASLSLTNQLSRTATFSGATQLATDWDKLGLKALETRVGSNKDLKWAPNITV